MLYIYPVSFLIAVQVVASLCLSENYCHNTEKQMLLVVNNSETPHNTRTEPLISWPKLKARLIRTGKLALFVYLLLQLHQDDDDLTYIGYGSPFTTPLFKTICHYCFVAFAWSLESRRGLKYTVLVGISIIALQHLLNSTAKTYNITVLAKAEIGLQGLGSQVLHIALGRFCWHHSYLRNLQVFLYFFYPSVLGSVGDQVDMNVGWGGLNPWIVGVYIIDLIFPPDELKLPVQSSWKPALAITVVVVLRTILVPLPVRIDFPFGRIFG
ncbi:hypothetical protein FT662_03273 [Candidozyma haemuli var. vulneris]|nr:hypothetical protein FT662_03273 [[Candida] haemuloni var. vulneris]